MYDCTCNTLLDSVHQIHLLVGLPSLFDSLGLIPNELYF